MGSKEEIYERTDKKVFLRIDKELKLGLWHSWVNGSKTKDLTENDDSI